MGDRSWAMALLLVFPSTAAFAQVKREPEVDATTRLGFELLPPPTRPLELVWPRLFPDVSFMRAETVASADGPLSAFRLQTTWLESGRLRLQSFGEADLAAFDCRELCRPALEQRVGVELRLGVTGDTVGRQPGTYFFMEQALGQHLDLKRSLLLRIGFAGAFR